MKYDLAIIGGGIIGAGVARDAALRGLKVLLVEKEDFASGTTSRSTRLIHGGLRYLAQYDFALVREALHERRTLLRIAPHLVRPLPFLLPLYRGHGHPLPMLWSGLMLYDYLALRRGVPHHRYLPGALCRQLEPTLKAEGLRGAFLFYDCQCPFPERLALENVLDAAEHHATIENHARVVGLEVQGGQVVGIRVRDEFSGAIRQIEAELVLNCAGPWLDEVERLADPAATPKLRRTKGVHLVVERFTQHALILETQDTDRVVFAIPWGEYTLVGTTDTDYEAANEDVAATRDDVAYLLRELGAVVSKKITPSDILFTTAGLRPLPRESGKKTADITRRHEIVDHEARDGLRGYVSVVGGKITTYRHIAEDIVNYVLRKLGRSAPRSLTADTPLPGGRFKGPWSQFVDRFLNEGARAGIPADVARHLAQHYGAQAFQVLEAVRTRSDLAERLQPDGPWIWAQVHHAVLQEKAATLSDVMLRRLTLGLARGQGRAVAPQVAAVMAPHLRWDAARVRQEVNQYLATLERNWPRSPTA